jgi:hypothetical protein
MAPRDVAAEGLVAVARSEAPAEIEPDVLRRASFELRAGSEREEQRIQQ